jgi:hypothetical protein
MIFEKVFCCISENEVFKFRTKEIFSDLFALKKHLTDELALVTTFQTSPTNFELGAKFYDLKENLWAMSKMPLIIKSGNYTHEEDEIKTEVEIYCLKKDYSFIKKKADQWACL